MVVAFSAQHYIDRDSVQRHADIAYRSFKKLTCVGDSVYGSHVDSTVPAPQVVDTDASRSICVSLWRWWTAWTPILDVEHGLVAELNDTAQFQNQGSLRPVLLDLVKCDE